MSTKLKKYLVSWNVTQQIPTGCPDIKIDPYTGLSTGISCAVNHYKTETKYMEKVFNTQAEANKFIEEAPGQCWDFKVSEVKELYAKEH